MSTDMATGQYRQRDPPSAAYSQAEDLHYDNHHNTDPQGYYTNQAVSSLRLAQFRSSRDKMDANSALHSTIPHMTTRL